VFNIVEKCITSVLTTVRFSAVQHVDQYFGSCRYQVLDEYRTSETAEYVVQSIMDNQGNVGRSLEHHS
jgi:hypothetical protein